jgi:hypothetical protein
MKTAARPQVLTERFFPKTGQADLDDIIGERQAGPRAGQERVAIPYAVTKEQVEEVIRGLPAGKAPGPDGVPYEILKEIAPEISKGLAQAFTERLAA